MNSIEQLTVLATVLKRADYNTTQQMRETAVALQCCANLIDAEVAKKDELAKQQESENESPAT